MSYILCAVEYSTESGGPGAIPPGYPAGTQQINQPPLGTQHLWISQKNHTPGTSFQRFRVLAASDVAGTVEIQQSWNGVNWFVTNTASVVADYTQGVVLEGLACAFLVRAVYKNGVAPQTHFTLITAEVAGASA